MRLCKYLIGLTLFFFICSCTGYKTSKKVRSITGEKIVFPAMTIFGEIDSTNNQIEANKIASIVLWFDSTECSLCRFESLPNIDYIYTYCYDSLPMGSVDVITLFSPSKEQLPLFRNIIETSNLIYPIYLDDNNLFEELNQFIPKEHQYHSFLINKDSKIMIVGGPFHNNKMWDLYKSLLNKIVR